MNEHKRFGLLGLKIIKPLIGDIWYYLKVALKHLFIYSFTEIFTHWQQRARFPDNIPCEKLKKWISRAIAIWATGLVNGPMLRHYIRNIVLTLQPQCEQSGAHGHMHVHNLRSSIFGNVLDDRPLK